jgi:hypothetical protein
MNNHNRAKRYAQRWYRYQDRCDVLVYGRNLYFLNKEYDGSWKSQWAVHRHKLVNRGFFKDGKNVIWRDEA